MIKLALPEDHAVVGYLTTDTGAQFVAVQRLRDGVVHPYATYRLALLPNPDGSWNCFYGDYVRSHKAAIGNLVRRAGISS